MRNIFSKFYKNANKNFVTKDDVNKALEAKNMKRCIEKLKDLQNNKNFVKLKLLQRRQAAVLIALCHVNENLCLLYTVRTFELKRHAGQVSFPGGMIDENESVEDAARRETEEELGIKRETIIVYGSGGPVPGMNVAITPVVGYIKDIGDVKKLNISKQEVKDVFTLPVVDFCKPENCKHTQFRDGFSSPVYIINNHRVWGVTAFITHAFLSSFIPNFYHFKIPYIKPLYK